MFSGEIIIRIIFRDSISCGWKNGIKWHIKKKSMSLIARSLRVRFPSCCYFWTCLRLFLVLLSWGLYVGLFPGMVFIKMKLNLYNLFFLPTYLHVGGTLGCRLCLYFQFFSLFTWRYLKNSVWDYPNESSSFNLMPAFMQTWFWRRKGNKKKILKATT